MAAGKKKLKTILWIFLFVVVAGGATIAWIGYTWIYGPSLEIEQEESYLYVHTGWEYEQVKESLTDSGWISNLKAFDWVANRKNLPAHIKPGRYAVFNGMSNDSLINLLRSGKQSEVMLVVPAKRTLADLAGVLDKELEPDSVEFYQVLSDQNLMDSLGFTPDTWIGMFIPNSYRFFWNTSARQVVVRMHREFLNFWNEERRIKLKSTGLTVDELMTLASIIQDETAKVSDMPIIAGVYMNRLSKGIKLQACPTVIYAWGEPRIRRLLNKHLKIDSPYNTYIHSGLPPGPIRMASIQAIDACLNYQRHNYLYFSAKEDFSGETVFARTYAEHLNNARKYQRALNQREIF